VQELPLCWTVAFQMDLDAIFAVEYPSSKIQFRRNAIDKRAEAYALHHSPDFDQAGSCAHLHAQQQQEMILGMSCCSGWSTLNW
jgi:hypothetical protein